MRHINIPVFIPHLGCPNDCVFCNQRTISSTCDFDEREVTGIIDNAIETSDGAEREIAFFGGSFTGIDRQLMIRLLDVAESYVEKGEVSGIRLSTRPDYINPEIIEILKKYTISQVELGIQSMSDNVLSASKRGHTAADTERAVRLLTDAGFEVVGQMMIGLPSSTLSDEIYCANMICDMGCSASRIYPTVVLKDTKLDQMSNTGEYAPLSLEEAVSRSASVLDVFERRGVKCIRIGLCDNENLHSEATYSAGPNHAAIGELVAGKLFYERIREFVNLNNIASELKGRCVAIECPRGAISKIVGNKGENRSRLEKEFGIKRLKTIENNSLFGYNIKVYIIN